MRANEFVKKFGWEKSKMAVNGFLPLGEGMPVFDYNSEDLKRLIESHELVEACGGIDVVKRHLKEGNVFRFEEKPLMRQAIADVESCQ